MREPKVSATEVALSNERVSSEHVSIEPVSSEHRALLERYFDGQGGLFDNLRVRWLLSSSSDALKYLNRLKELKEATCGWVAEVRESRAIDGGDMWSKISARIDQEEHTEILLGQRKLVDAEPGGIASWASGWLSRGAWGIGGAVASAVVSFMVYGSSGTDSSYQMAERIGSVGQSNSQGNSSVGKVGVPVPKDEDKVFPTELVSFSEPASNVKRRLNRIFYRRGLGRQLQSGQFDGVESVDSSSPSTFVSEAPIEVDWMRSGSGRVNVINNEDRNATIFWVIKNQSVDENSSQTPRVIDQDFRAIDAVPAFR